MEVYSEHNQLQERETTMDVKHASHHRISGGEATMGASMTTSVLPSAFRNGCIPSRRPSTAQKQAHRTDA